MGTPSFFIATLISLIVLLGGLTGAVLGYSERIMRAEDEHEGAPSGPGADVLPRTTT